MYKGIMGESLRIGIIASQEEVIILRHLLPEVEWYRYEGLEQFLRYGRSDKIEIIIIDFKKIEKCKKIMIRGNLVILKESGGLNLLKLICKYFPTIILIESGAVIPRWVSMRNLSVIRRPVDAETLKKMIHTIRLRRLFQEVATTYGPSSSE
jgi:hypothetical protein